MTIACRNDLAAMKRAGRVVAETLRARVTAATPGRTTGELDSIASKMLRDRGARSAPQLCYGFPGWTCISINDEIVHGVPGTRAIRPGDVVKVDVTAELDGFIADAATTVLAQPASPVARALVRCARAAFDRAVQTARPGRPVRAIGLAIEQEVRRHGFFVLRELTGHGVGRHIHEEPAVPNFADPLAVQTLHEGLVLAVEPIVTEIAARAVRRPDGWTLATHNGTLAVHHEHTIVIQDGPPLVLTEDRGIK